MTKPTTPKNTNTGKSSKRNPTTGHCSKAEVRAWDPQRDYVDLTTITSSKQQAARLFVALANGHRIHRLNVDQYIPELRKNCSLHSVVATLERIYDLPVGRAFTDIFDVEGQARVKEFYFTSEVLEALDDMFKREALAEDFRRFRENRYMAKQTKAFKKLLSIIEEFPELAKLHPEQSLGLSEIKAQLEELESDGVINRVKHDTH